MPGLSFLVDGERKVLKTMLPDGNLFEFDLAKVVDLDGDSRAAKNLSDLEIRVLEAGISGLVEMGLYEDAVARGGSVGIQRVLATISVGRPLTISYIDTTPAGTAFLVPVLFDNRLVGSANIALDTHPHHLRLVDVWATSDVGRSPILSQDLPGATVAGPYKIQGVLGAAMPRDAIRRVRFRSPSRQPGPMDFFWCNPSSAQHFLRSDGAIFRNDAERQTQAASARGGGRLLTQVGSL